MSRHLAVKTTRKYTMQQQEGTELLVTETEVNSNKIVKEPFRTLKHARTTSIPRRGGRMDSPTSPVETTFSQQQTEDNTTTTNEVDTNRPQRAYSVLVSLPRVERYNTMRRKRGPLLDLPSTASQEDEEKNNSDESSLLDSPTSTTNDSIVEYIRKSERTAEEAAVFTPRDHMELNGDYFSDSVTGNNHRTRSNTFKVYQNTTIIEQIQQQRAINPQIPTNNKPKILRDQEKLQIMNTNNYVTARAVDEFQPDSSNQIALNMNDILHVLRVNDDGTSFVMNVSTGRTGYVPTEYYCRTGSVSLEDSIKPPQKAPPPVPNTNNSSSSSTSLNITSSFSLSQITNTINSTIATETLSKSSSKITSLLTSNSSKQKKKKAEQLVRCTFLNPYTEDDGTGVAMVSFDHLF